MIDDTLVHHPLFGGAAEMSFPNRFTDISDFRPIPDHQEVFADGSLDQSLVVEILEQQPEGDASAAAYFFHDLATNNEAPHSQIDDTTVLGPTDMPGVPEGCFKSLLVGQQVVSKGRQGSSALNKIQVALCVVRLPQQVTDLLITLNTPIFISEHSAAAEHAGAGFKGAHLTAPLLFRQMLKTFKIVDWSLFGAQP